MKILLIVLLTLALVCIGISFLRVGGRAEYSSAGFLAQVKIGPFFLTIYPRRSKKKGKKERKQEEQEPSPSEEQKSRISRLWNKSAQLVEKSADFLKGESGGDLQVLVDELPAILDLLGETVRKLRVDELYLDYTIAGRNEPASAAILYGRICASGGVVAALLRDRLNIKRQRVRAWVDFTTAQTKVYGRLTLSYTIGQLAVIGVHVLRELLNIKKRMKNQNQEGKEDGKQASNQ